eukprot:1156043-Pelagomonas_calceolata.AAC.8
MQRKHVKRELDVQAMHAGNGLMLCTGYTLLRCANRRTGSSAPQTSPAEQAEKLVRNRRACGHPQQHAPAAEGVVVFSTEKRYLRNEDVKIAARPSLYPLLLALTHPYWRASSRRKLSLSTLPVSAGMGPIP